LKNDLDEAVSEVLLKHNKSLLTITDRGYGLALKSKYPAGLDFGQCIKLVDNAARFFSVLMLKPIRPIELSLLGNSEDGHHESFPVLISLHLTSSQMKALQSDQNHHLLPVNINGVKANFHDIFSQWNEYASENLSIVLPTLLNHINGQYNFVQNYVLLLTAIEKWAMDENENYKTIEKYDWFINEYGSDELKTHFCKYLPTEKTIGEHLSDIRKCIVHPATLRSGGKRKYKDILHDSSLDNLNELMFILLIIALYNKLGIDQGVVTKISEKYSNYIRTYETIE